MTEHNRALDCRGVPLTEGCQVVYPVSQGSRSAHLIVGVVRAVNYDDTFGVRVSVAREFDSGRWDGSVGIKPTLVRAERCMRVVLP